MMTLDRRTLLKLGGLGLGALSVPALAQQIFTARGFTHGVASGEPGPSSVLLWTRYVADQDTLLRAEIARDSAFRHIVGGANHWAQADQDFCVRVTMTDLPDNRWLYYRFIAPDGTQSMVGRTRTLPQDAVTAFNLALFSCANIGFGWFNAYGHAARRKDIDLAVHVGDYIYEYGPGVYPSAKQMLAARTLLPPAETVSLADYRLRYAAYRADRALQALHARMPMIAMWDDHEFANDAWVGGAENHRPEQGRWVDRRRAAVRAFQEWMPVSNAPFRQYQIGDLATILLPETRITGRTQQLNYAQAIAGQSDVTAALRTFRDTAWISKDRTLLGADQERWLATEMARSTRQKTRWQILAQQVVMGSMVQPPEARGWIMPDAPDYVQRRVTLGDLAAQVGLPANLDAWDGYPAARQRLLGAAQAADANLVVLTGDTHNGWAYDLTQDGAAVGAEIAGHSVTSSGLESSTPRATDQDRVAALRRANPTLRWANTDRRGYVSVAINRDRVRATWHLLDTVRADSQQMVGSHSMNIRHGARRYADAG